MIKVSSSAAAALALIAWALSCGDSVRRIESLEDSLEEEASEEDLGTAMTLELGTQWQLWNGKPKYTDIEQGMLGDCYLLATMASIVNRHPEVIQHFFTRHQRKKADGTTVYIMSFVVNGRDTKVAVDDLVPYDSWYRKFYFTTTHDGDDIWPMLVEKGYAKIYGSYMGIRAGWDNQAIKDLTQAPTDSVILDFSTPGRRYFQNKDKLWADMVRCQKEEWPMQALTMSPPKPNPYGVPVNHAYAVLSVRTALRHRNKTLEGRFVQIFNPWGSDNKYRGSITGQAADRGYYWMTFGEFCEIFWLFSWARIRHGYKLSFAARRIELKTQKIYKFYIDSDKPFTLLLEWPMLRMAQNVADDCPDDSHKVMFQLWAARLDGHGNVVPGSTRIGGMPLFFQASNGRLELQGRGVWIVYIFVQVYNKEPSESWITHVAVNAYHHEEAGYVVFQESPPPNGGYMQMLGGLERCEVLELARPGHWGSFAHSGHLSVFYGGPDFQGRNGSLWLYNGQWMLGDKEVEVTGCSSYRRESLLEEGSNASAAAAALSLQRTGARSGAADGLAAAAAAHSLQPTSASAGAADGLDCGYYVRRLNAGLNNAEEIAQTGVDRLFPPEGPSIGRESDDCGDSARGGSKQSCMKFNHWASISRVLSGHAHTPCRPAYAVSLILVITVGWTGRRAAS